MNSVLEKRSQRVSSRTSVSTKKQLQKIKDEYGYTSGDLLEMAVNNLLYNEEQELKNSLNLLRAERRVLRKQEKQISRNLEKVHEELDKKESRINYLRDELKLHGYEEDEALMNAKDAFISACNRRNERSKTSFSSPEGTEDELIISIAHKYGVKAAILKKVVAEV